MSCQHSTTTCFLVWFAVLRNSNQNWSTPTERIPCLFVCREVLFSEARGGERQARGNCALRVSNLADGECSCIDVIHSGCADLALHVNASAVQVLTSHGVNYSTLPIEIRIADCYCYYKQGFYVSTVLSAGIWHFSGEYSANIAVAFTSSSVWCISWRPLANCYKVIAPRRSRWWRTLLEKVIHVHPRKKLEIIGMKAVRIKEVYLLYPASQPSSHPPTELAQFDSAKPQLRRRKVEIKRIRIVNNCYGW